MVKSGSRQVVDHHAGSLAPDELFCRATFGDQRSRRRSACSGPVLSTGLLLCLLLGPQVSCLRIGVGTGGDADLQAPADGAAAEQRLTDGPKADRSPTADSSPTADGSPTPDGQPATDGPRADSLSLPDAAPTGSLVLTGGALLSDVLFGQTGELTVTATNTSSTTLTALGIVDPGAPWALGQSTCGATLGGGQSCEVRLSFTSPGRGSFPGLLRVDYLQNGSARTAVHEVAATGLPGVATAGKIYPLHGNWNDYVQRSDPTRSAYEQVDLGCSGDQPGRPQDCIHGGEKLRVAAPGLSSCAGASVVDALGAFDWLCDGSTTPVRFHSRGLKRDKCLADLLTAAGWRANHVTVRAGGRDVLVSAPASWWTNPVLELPDNASGTVATLATGGAVYVLSSSRASNGYVITAHRVSLTTLPGATLRYGGSATFSCNGWNGAASSPDRRCLVSGADARFLWIEGSYDGAPSAGEAAQRAIFLVGTRFSNLRGLRVVRAAEAGVMMRVSSGNRLAQIYADGNGTGLSLSGDQWDLLTDITVANSAGRGLYLMDGEALVLAGISAYNNAWEGIYQGRGTATLTSILATGNDESGLFLDTTLPTTVSHVTATNNGGGGGVRLYRADQALLVQILSVNNNCGLMINSAEQVRVAQAVSAHNEFAASLVWSSDAVFTENLLFGSNYYGCEVGDATNPGLTATCQLAGGSDATLRSGVTLHGTLLGKVFSDDPLNPVDTSGSAAYEAIIGGGLFASAFRSWGRDGLGSFPGDEYFGRCASGSCRIWDWRLSGLDQVIRQRSDDGLSANAAFVDGGPCPAAASGDRVLTDVQGNTFLVNAREIFDDERGDEDGLCESGEACLYSPSFGAFQGAGAYDSHTCTFQAGAVTGVELHGFPQDGL